MMRGVEATVRRLQMNRLSKGQIAILSAMDEWADKNPEPQPKKDIEERCGYSKQFVNVVLHAFEAMGYINLLRPKCPAQGHRVILMWLPDEWYKRTGKVPGDVEEAV
jgi:hypothetical protein